MPWKQPDLAYDIINGPFKVFKEIMYTMSMINYNFKFVTFQMKNKYDKLLHY